MDENATYPKTKPKNYASRQDRPGQLPLSSRRQPSTHSVPPSSTTSTARGQTRSHIPHADPCARLVGTVGARPLTPTQLSNRASTASGRFISRVQTISLRIKFSYLLALKAALTTAAGHISSLRLYHQFNDIVAMLVGWYIGRAADYIPCYSRTIYSRHKKTTTYFNQPIFLVVWHSPAKMAHSATTPKLQIT